MPDFPVFGFYRRPRFSANHLAEYLCTTDAVQREGVIRRAKFPRRVPVTAYQQAVPHFRRFLTGGSSDLRFFDSVVAAFQAKAEREEGYSRDEALRCIAAIDAFKVTFTKARLKKLMFLAGPSDAHMKVEGVSINVHIDPPIIERRNDGSMASGGCVLLLAGSAEARKNINERTKTVAGIIHWVLKSNPSNMPAAAKLCMSFDAFGGQVVRAPDGFSRLRGKIAGACREATGSWDRIEPPTGYDGPDWQ